MAPNFHGETCRKCQKCHCECISEWLLIGGGLFCVACAILVAPATVPYVMAGGTLAGVLYVNRNRKDDQITTQVLQNIHKFM